MANKPRRRTRSVDAARRKFIGWIGKGLTFTTGAAVGGWIENRAEDQWDGQFGNKIPTGRQLTAEELRAYRIGFINERIITLNGNSVVCAGDLNRRLGKPEIPPDLSHDRLALAKLRSLRRIQDTGDDLVERDVERFDSFICSGSPVANDISAAYLPVCDLADDPSEDRRPVVSPAEIPYHFVTGYENSVKVVSGAAGGKIAWKRNNGIRDLERGNAICHPLNAIDRDGFLANDYLILMRAPRNPFGGEILIAAGLHGPATHAFDLLFDPVAFPDSEIEFLENSLANEPYWQAVFEVSSISHVGPMSIARQLRVSRRLPPKPVHQTQSFFVST